MLTLITGTTNGIGNSIASKLLASDQEVIGVDNKELGTWIKNNIDYDQLILEFYKEGEPTSGWIHVSYVGKENRKSTLIAYKDAEGKTEYKPW